MDRPVQDKIIARARDAYREWAARPWYVKVWDRICSEAGYIAFRLKKH
ncbi:hypothetical protein HCJ93_08450 [Streptomyces sp. SBST2-5]|uniref:Uncharacterized protein n=1 Tax=Streptomyces composti TaxID=2720025 RepID=A0ABX1A8S0_9ACTN|nr:hypothetical protein [Streptomyces composti]NJP50101.1 hypothetical protein [Streptomyces composti]